MTWSSQHVRWLIDSGERLYTADGIVVEIWDLQYEEDEAVLSDWAKHFRNHYCLDTEIDFFRSGTGYSRAEYLDHIKFPDCKKAPGPSVRAGDFGEVLIADFLEYVHLYWVPRTRYGDKDVRNESTKGSDILGFKLVDEDGVSPDDILAVFEAKTQFSGKSPKPRLQDAINDSAKDWSRKGESLNATKQRLFRQNDIGGASIVERFQNEVDNPYKEQYGAAALFDDTLFSSKEISSSVTQDHFAGNTIVLLVIKGTNMMRFVHELYRRAADEA